MYGYNAFNDYGYGNSNPPPPPPVGNAGFGQLITQPVPPTTNYKNTQFTYPGGALAYTQLGVTAAPQQIASSMAFYGQQPQTTGSYSPVQGYSMYNAPSASSADDNMSAAAGRGAKTAVSLSGVNSTAFGQNTDYYSGYEQNLFAAAVPSYWQIKNSAQTNNSMRGGKRGKGNSRGSSNRRGIGNQHREPQQQLFCDVCKVTCGGNLTYKLHLEGKAHKNKEAISKGEKVQCLPRGKVTFKCDVCNVMCSAQDIYDTHVKGAQHQKRIATLKKMGQPLPPVEPTLIPPKNPSAKVPAPSVPGANKKIVGVSGTMFVGGTQLHTTGTATFDSGLDQPVTLESNIAMVGQEFIEELIGVNGKMVYSCKLCNCKLTDANEKVNHLKGRRHRLQYKIKINPTIEVDNPKTPNSAWKNRGKQGGYFCSPQPYLHHSTLETPIQTRPFFQQQRMGHCVESSDDRHVIAKSDAIYPTKPESDALQKLVALAERTLKNISDKFAEEEKVATSTASTEINTADANPERLLKGVMRVGLLAKNLLLSTDKEVNLVVLCSKIPTESLLKKVCDLFPDSVEEEETELLQLTQNIPEACLLISFAGSPVVCRITFTSVLMREVASVCVTSPGQMTPGSAIEKPSDALSAEPCLKALDELKRAKFYQVKCATLHSMNIALRIVRDISRRVKTWTVLSQWAMELLTEKALSSIQVSLGPGDAVRRVFEVIAGGSLLKGGSSLIDPCEKESTDVLACLHDQEREDITSSAQHALRLISFNQIYKVLAIDRLPDVKIMETFNRSGLFGGAAAAGKRTRESGGFCSADGTSDSKKERRGTPPACL